MYYCKMIELPSITLEVEEGDSILDLGIIKSNDKHSTYSVEWHLRSKSGLPIQINDIVPSCECITIEYEYNSFLFNEVIIHAIYNHDKSISGEFYRELEVSGNFASPIYLELQGKVVE